MRIAVRLLVILLILCVGVVLVFWVGALASTDWDRGHSQATDELPRFSGNEHNAVVRLPLGDLEFRHIASGLAARSVHPRRGRTPSSRRASAHPLLLHPPKLHLRTLQ